MPHTYEYRAPYIAMKRWGNEDEGYGQGDIDLGEYEARLLWSFRRADTAEEIACISFIPGSGRVRHALSALEGLGSISR